MYYAELGYKTGYASFVNGLVAGLVMIFIGRTGFIVKRLRAMRLMTVPEFFEVKFSRNLRVFTGILVATGGILNMGVFLKVEGTFLAIISGISLNHIKAVMTGILLAGTGVHRARRNGVDRYHRLHSVRGAEHRHNPGDHLVGPCRWVLAHVRRRAPDDGRRRLQPVLQSGLWMGLRRLPGVDLAGGPHLLADNRDAHLLDSQPGDQPSGCFRGQDSSF